MTIPPLKTAVIVGAAGGLGAAFVDALANEQGFQQIFAFSRTGRSHPDARVTSLRLDPLDPDQLALAVSQCAAPIHRLIITTGMLHDGIQSPEKSWKALDSGHLARSFAVNAIAPIMAVKAFLPLIPKGERAEIGLLSARVGSISDNRTGGWHGYRASKAALNQLIKTTAIELSRSHPELVCVALHPGTVDTAMSAPFQRGLPPERLFTPAYSASQMLSLLDRLLPSQSGGLFAWDGTPIQP